MPNEPSAAARAWIALGSNLGDRAAVIRTAIERLSALPRLRVTAVSSLHETEAVGGPLGQGRYLNAAAELAIEAATGADGVLGNGHRSDPGAPATGSSGGDSAGHRTARWLLASLLEVERSLGRLRDPHERNAPRTIDLDLLLVERVECFEPPPANARVPSAGAWPASAVIVREPGLELPHPRLHERRFVLGPLAEIAPELRHPILGATVTDLLRSLPASTEDARLGRGR